MRKKEQCRKKTFGRRQKEGEGGEKEIERAGACLCKAGFCFHGEGKMFFVIKSLE